MNLAKNIHTIMKQESQRKDLFQFKRIAVFANRHDMAIPGKPYIL